MTQQPQQSFTISDLTGEDVQIIMQALDEQPSKIGRRTMNKLEGQLVQQVMAAQMPPADPGAPGAPVPPSAPVPPAPPSLDNLEGESQS